MKLKIKRKFDANKLKNVPLVRVDNLNIGEFFTFDGEDRIFQRLERGSDYNGCENVLVYEHGDYSPFVSKLRSCQAVKKVNVKMKLKVENHEE